MRGIMKRVVTLLLVVLVGTLFAYNVGDTVGDLSWTDSNGENHSIHEVIDSGKVILFFWGENW